MRRMITRPCTLAGTFVAAPGPVILPPRRPRENGTTCDRTTAFRRMVLRKSIIDRASAKPSIGAPKRGVG